jgi:hypothetical protein
MPPPRSLNVTFNKGVSTRKRWFTLTSAGFGASFLPVVSHSRSLLALADPFWPVLVAQVWPALPLAQAVAWAQSTSGRKKAGQSLLKALSWFFFPLHSSAILPDRNHHD